MLKMLTGLVAKALRPGRAEANEEACAEKAPAAITDSEMLDWLDRHNTWSGLVAFRWSTTDIGWRLMEVAFDYPGATLRKGSVAPPSRTAREAIANAMPLATPRTRWGFSDAVLSTDAQRLDWLDEQYHTGTIYRFSTCARGWRLQSRDGAGATVRDAISGAMLREAAVGACKAAATGRLGRPKKPSNMYCVTQTGPETFECIITAQDGFDGWDETSLDAAVKSVIRAADAINHAPIAYDNITIRLLDPRRSRTSPSSACRKCPE